MRERGLAISKRKTLETAQKYVQKGAFDKALKEYLKHLKVEPDDTNARLKMGDVHLKRGDPAAAIEAYSQVASLFSKGGFDAKAVAIFKQILRIDDQNLAAHVSLGDHFQRMGLNKDALREFQAGVKICQERGLKSQAFDLLKRVSALDPGNVPNRLSLAELLMREGMAAEARAEFESLLSEVEREAEGDNLERVSQAMLEAFPEDERAHRGFARAKLKLGLPAQAAEALANVVSDFPDSIELREDLVEALEATGDQEAANATYHEIAELYRRSGDQEKAREILQRHSPVEAFGDGDETPPSLVLEDVNEDARKPDTLDSLGSLDLEPTSHVPEPKKAKSRKSKKPKPKEKKKEKAPLPSDGADELLAEARVAFEFGDAEGARASVEKLLAKDPNSIDGRKLLAKIDREAASDDDSVEELGIDSLPDIELVLEDEDTGLADEYSSIEPPPELELTETIDDDATAAASKSARATQLLDRANALHDAGKTDEAEQAYRLVLEDAPNHPQAMLRLGEIEALRGEVPSGSTAATAKPAPSGEVSIDEGIDFEFEDGDLFDDEPEVEVEVQEPQQTEPPKEPKKLKEPEPTPQEELIDESYFADVLGDDDEPPSQDRFDLAAELDGDEGASDEDFQEVFDAFKKGVQEQISEGDSETHYDLAIAYKEMGLLEDAIEQLDMVRRSGKMQIEALSLMATCKVEIGRPQEAAGHLSEALVCASDGDEAVVSLRYDLGEALLAAGKHGEALEAFQKVTADDADFRDVKQRISKLGR